MVAVLEQRWGGHLRPGEFDAACRTLDHLLASLDAAPGDSVPSRGGRR
jgi:hypothetical protein